MIKDIPKYVVTDVAIAVIKESEAEEASETDWSVYLINMKHENIYGVLVASKGYGTYNGEDVKTSTLRHFIEDIPAESYAKIEPIQEKLFAISNEYWISFYHEGNLYDKKYVFVPESIKEEHFTNIPIINKRGVMIK